VSLDLDLGVQREAVEVAAQFTRQEERANVAAPTEPLDAGAALLTDGDPTLHRGGVGFGQQRLVGLDLVIVRLDLGKSAAASEVTQDATVQARGDLDDVLVGERLGALEDRASERARARVDPVEHQRMEVEVEIERTPEALRDDDRARAAGRDARALAALPRAAIRAPGRNRAWQSTAIGKGDGNSDP